MESGRGRRGVYSVGLGIGSENWDELEKAAVFQDTNGYHPLEIGFPSRSRSARSHETRGARQRQRPMECPKCGHQFPPIRGLRERDYSGNRIWLSGWNRTSERPRYMCSICLKKFSGPYTLEFPGKERVIKHGRSRYTKNHCRCDVCRDVMRDLWKRKSARRKALIK